MVVWLKHWLVELGPDGRLVRAALMVNGLLRRISVRFDAERVSLGRDSRQMLVLKRHFVYLPMLMRTFDAWFEDLVPNCVNGVGILDFSEPGLRTYCKDRLKLWSSSLPEEDSSELYMRHYVPKRGDTVWDVGANCGLTTYQFSRAVGASGHVIAWEPDGHNRVFLGRNIGMHQLTNVTVEPSALSEKTGTAQFDSDGSTGAGLSQFLAYSVADKKPAVPTLSLADAVERYGTPALLKMDIEGGELGVMRGALPYLKERRPTISFAMETHPLNDGSHTGNEVAEIFQSAGYGVKRGNDRLGQSFLWAFQPSETC